MSALVVCDASAVVALLVDDGPEGRWVADALAGADLVAPHLVSFECANVIRRLELAGLISSDQAAQAHADLLDLVIEHWPYDLIAARAWELRRNLSSFDASYAALAELTSATLVTLDRRMQHSPHVTCRVATP